MPLKKRGLTLVEMLMVSSLLLVMLALAVQILLPVMRSYAKSDRRSVLLQRVAASLDKVEAEIADSNVRGLHFVAAPTVGLVVQPLGPPGSSGTAFWTPELHVFCLRQEALRFFSWRSKKLAQHTIAEPYVPTLQELPEILTQPAESQLLVAAGVVSFTVEGLEPLERRLPLTVRLPAKSSAGEKFQLSREVIPRSAPSR